MCDHRLWGDPDGLVCDLATPHDPTARGGHTYADPNGSSTERPEVQES